MPCGGAAVPHALQEAYERELGVRIVQAWGMTETSPLGSIAHPPAGTPAGPPPRGLAERDELGERLVLRWLDVLEGEILELPPHLRHAEAVQRDQMQHDHRDDREGHDVAGVEPLFLLALVDDQSGGLQHITPPPRGKLGAPAAGDLVVLVPRDVQLHDPGHLGRQPRQLRKRLYGRTKPGTLLKHHIPLKTDRWAVTLPGFTEIDLVAHCGSLGEGEFVHSLNLTDTRLRRKMMDLQAAQQGEQQQQAFVAGGELLVAEAQRREVEVHGFEFPDLESRFARLRRR